MHPVGVHVQEVRRRADGMRRQIASEKLQYVQFTKSNFVVWCVCVRVYVAEYFEATRFTAVTLSRIVNGVSERVV